MSRYHRWQKAMYEKHGIHFVHASDEWYILAGQDLPEEERYDGYIQLENGVECCGFWIRKCAGLWKSGRATQES